MSEFNLKGGVLVIGSLLWDPKQIRVDWRDARLDMTSMKLVPLPIRYGRISQSRLFTHTMVFSAECMSKLGQGYVVPFKKRMERLEDVDAEVLALMKAEMNRDLETANYSWGWGVVGLAINPALLLPDPAKEAARQRLAEHWPTRLAADFEPQEYKVPKEKSIVDKSGRILTAWPPELAEYDFVIATVVKPKPAKYPSAEDIATRMRYNHYTTYFRENTARGIWTFQDDEIEKGLNMPGVDYLNYLARCTVPVVVVHPQENLPENTGSGCAVYYRGRQFLLSVAHVTNREGFVVGIQTHVPTQGRQSQVYVVGAPWYFDEYALPDHMVQTGINSLEDLESNNKKTLDITFCELHEDVIMFQPEYTFQGQTIYRGPRYWLNLDTATTPETGKLYGFAGHVRQALRNGLLTSRPTFKLDLEFDKTEGRFHRFLYPTVITNAEDFQGCSGAPILDTEGRLVALAASVMVHSRVIKGFSIEACKQLMDMTIQYEQEREI